jgi:hypothetical protein
MGQSGEENLVAGAGDLEIYAALLLQEDLAVIERPGYAGQAEIGNELCGFESSQASRSRALRMAGFGRPGVAVLLYLGCEARVTVGT